MIKGREFQYCKDAISSKIICQFYTIAIKKLDIKEQDQASWPMDYVNQMMWRWCQRRF